MAGLDILVIYINCRIVSMEFVAGKTINLYNADPDILHVFMCLFAYYELVENPKHHHFKAHTHVEKTSLSNYSTKFVDFYEVIKELFKIYSDNSAKGTIIVMQTPYNKKMAVYNEGRFKYFESADIHSKVYRNPEHYAEKIYISVDVYVNTSEIEFKQVLHM